MWGQDQSDRGANKGSVIRDAAVCRIDEVRSVRDIAVCVRTGTGAGWAIRNQPRLYSAYLNRRGSGTRIAGGIVSLGCSRSGHCWSCHIPDFGEEQRQSGALHLNGDLWVFRLSEVAGTTRPDNGWHNPGNVVLDASGLSLQFGQSASGSAA